MKCFRRRFPNALTPVWLLLVLVLTARAARAVEISQIPLEMVYDARPAAMVVVDNSASMDCEFATPGPHGLFNGCYYVFPDTAYQPIADHLYRNGCTLDADQRKHWQSRWFGHNRLYYNPSIRYAPWPSTQINPYGPADLHFPKSDPRAPDSDTVRFAMAAPFMTVPVPDGHIVVPNAHYFTYSKQNTLYLVAWQDADGDGRIDLADTAGGDGRRYFRFSDDGDGVIETGELSMETDPARIRSLCPAFGGQMQSSGQRSTDRQELQNFANWFSYYRRRSFVATAVAAALISQFNDGRMGLFAVNGAPRLPLIEIATDPLPRTGGTTRQDSTCTLLNALYRMKTGGHSSLRFALDQIGRYYHSELASPLGVSPYRTEEMAMACRELDVILITDGFMNGWPVGVGNADGPYPFPHGDRWDDTLADVAMTYSGNDLAPHLPDRLPSGVCNADAHQRMVTHVVFVGTLSISGCRTGAATDHSNAALPAPCSHMTCLSQIDWPAASFGGLPELPPCGAVIGHRASHQMADPRLLDLLHAAVNGYGGFWLNMDIDGLARALRVSLMRQEDAKRVSTNIAVNGSGEAAPDMLFQGQYDPTDWSGDLVAWPLSVLSHGTDRTDATPLWKASTGLTPDGARWNQRCILSYGGASRHPEGIGFRFDQLGKHQIDALQNGTQGSPVQGVSAERLINYLRGRPTKGLRHRRNLLGDIVNSGIASFGQTVFVGANDGMLHAFDMRSGAERFAYVPNIVLDQIGATASPDYGYRHRNLVDGPITIGEVRTGDGRRDTYLIGGLGSGGKGYYGLRIGTRNRASGEDGAGPYDWLSHVDDLAPDGSEKMASKLVMWEYPQPNASDDGVARNGDGAIDEPGAHDPDLGYGFSDAYPVNANCSTGQFRPVVVFGNGYNSRSRKAVLYILDAATGRMLRKIDTGVGGDNGLSTPALVDVNLDRTIDYAYAGDLAGNLWKFDLTSQIPERWGVAYGRDINGDGVIDAARGDAPQPLFKAPDQPITGRPDVMRMHGVCASQVPGYMVVFGTGQYLGAEDRTDDRPQGLFGIWDYGDDSDDSETVGVLLDRRSGRLSSGFVLQTVAVDGEWTKGRQTEHIIETGAITYTVTEDTIDGDGQRNNHNGLQQQPDPVDIAGWRLDFAPSENGTTHAERVIGRAALRDGTATFISFAPSKESCDGDGQSRLYTIDACSGSRVKSKTATASIQAAKLDGRITASPLSIWSEGSGKLQRVWVYGDTTGALAQCPVIGEHVGHVYWRMNASP